MDTSTQLIVFLIGMLNFWFVLIALIGIISLLRHMRITKLAYAHNGQQAAQQAGNYKRSSAALIQDEVASHKMDVASQQDSSRGQFTLERLDDDPISFAIQSDTTPSEENRNGNEAQSVIKHRSQAKKNAS